MSGKAQQQSRLKELIQRGREQGYLTYAEVNDHLPEDISDPEQVEDIIRMINDMGINVFEVAPDADALLLAEADTDEAAAEEAAAALAAVETDIGRTTDPVRMYMREMGTVELLTREGEIEIAKRIEEGIREVMSAIAHFPGTVDSILADYERVTTEGGRLSDILSGYIDPDDDGAAGRQEEVEPVAPQTATKPAGDDKDDEEEDESDSEEEEGDGGPDPEVARVRFGAVAEQLDAAKKALKKHGRGSQQATDALLELATLFMPIKLIPKQYDALVLRVRDALSQVRAQERAIMQICVRDARMPRADFLRQFPNNETNLDWADQLSSSKAKYAEAIGTRKEEIQSCQQKLLALEEECALLIADIWPAVYVRYEAGLLQDLGFGLDLSKCASTGSTDDLTHVSPRTGRAVSAAAAEPYKDRLLPLPPFLLGAQAGLAPGDVGLGLDLTGHFLETFVFAVMNKPLPPARVWLLDKPATLQAPGDLYVAGFSLTFKQR